MHSKFALICFAICLAGCGPFTFAGEPPDSRRKFKFGVGDCTDAAVLGTWRQVRALNRDGSSYATWSKEDLTFRSDCSLEITELQYDRRHSRGYFRQVGLEVQADIWPRDRRFILDADHQQLVLVEEASMYGFDGEGQLHVEAERSGMPHGSPMAPANPGARNQE